MDKKVPYPPKMKALQFSEYGPPNVIKLITLDTPKVTSPHDIIVKVHASALDPKDCKMLHGELKLTPLPIVPGVDFSGVVVAKGDSQEANRFFLNDPVMGNVEFGANAEYVTVNFIA